MGTNPQNSVKKVKEHERVKGIATLLGARVCGNGSCAQIFFCDLACKKKGYAKAKEIDGCYCPKHAQEMDRLSATCYNATNRCDSRFKNPRLLNPTEIEKISVLKNQKQADKSMRRAETCVQNVRSDEQVFPPKKPQDKFVPFSR